MTSSEFEGQNVLVTGGSSGLGLAAAAAFAREGARVGIIAFSETEVTSSLDALRSSGSPDCRRFRRCAARSTQSPGNLGVLTMSSIAGHRWQAWSGGRGSNCSRFPEGFATSSALSWSRRLHSRTQPRSRHSAGLAIAPFVGCCRSTQRPDAPWADTSRLA